MTTARNGFRRGGRLAPAAPLTVAAAAAALVMRIVAQHTIDIVRAGHLLPRWDPGDAPPATGGSITTALSPAGFLSFFGISGCRAVLSRARWPVIPAADGRPVLSGCGGRSRTLGRCSRPRRTIAALLAPIVVASGVIAATLIVTEQRFRAIAFEHYTDSRALRVALDAIGGELKADDRPLIVGESDRLSPALLRWELGPPSGVSCFPFQIGGAGRLHPALATRVLVIGHPGAGFAPTGVEHYGPARIRMVREDVDRGDLTLRQEFALADLDITLRVYGRPAMPQRSVRCP